MYKRILPSPLLKDYVEYFWCGEIELSAGEVFMHYSVATSKAQLLFHYSGDFMTTGESGDKVKTFTAGVYGQTSSYKKYMTASEKPAIFGIQFYPHALPTLFSIPADELTNQALDVSELFGAQGLELIEKVFSHKSFEQKVKIVSDLLEPRIKKQKIKYRNIESAIHQIHHFKGNVILPDLISYSCLSQRQFERSFKELAGFSPKAYIKIVRFESLLETYENADKSLTEMAFEFGYYDQAHFNHDFKKFSGLSPTQYLHYISDSPF